MTAKKKEKETKNKATTVEKKEEMTTSQLTTADELKNFLNGIRDKMSEGSAAPIYAMTAMNYIMNEPAIYKLLTEENKEIARDIWLRLKHAGIQLKNPPLLFGTEALADGPGMAG
jgi:hypothetical protein